MRILVLVVQNEFAKRSFFSYFLKMKFGDKNENQTKQQQQQQKRRKSFQLAFYWIIVYAGRLYVLFLLKNKE